MQNDKLNIWYEPEIEKSFPIVLDLVAKLGFHFMRKMGDIAALSVTCFRTHYRRNRESNR